MFLSKGLVSKTKQSVYVLNSFVTSESVFNFAWQLYMIFGVTIDGYYLFGRCFFFFPKTALSNFISNRHPASHITFLYHSAWPGISQHLLSPCQCKNGIHLDCNTGILLVDRFTTTWRIKSWMLNLIKYNNTNFYGKIREVKDTQQRSIKNYASTSINKQNKIGIAVLSFS